MGRGGGADLIATEFAVSFNAVIATLQGVFLIGPALAFVITRMACGAAQQLERERRAHPPESGVIVRRPDGGYEELPLSPIAAPELTGHSASLDAEQRRDLQHRQEAGDGQDHRQAYDRLDGRQDDGADPRRTGTTGAAVSRGRLP